ncbi:YitT family protein, partial [Paenibacillus validus]|uniref:YitT family protein n=1 Tax=Paenibacillus validus TaxID=44253 RepID=UPI003D2D2418
MGGGWFNSHRGYDYRGYTSSKRYDDYGKYQTAPYPSASAPAKTPAQTAPSTSDRKGSFTTTPTKPSTGAGSSSGSVRRNDGSTPSYGKAPSSDRPSRVQASDPVLLNENNDRNVKLSATIVRELHVSHSRRIPMIKLQRSWIGSILVTVLSSAFIAASFNLFLIPHQLLSGGLSGIA